EQVEALGGGWVAEEALAIALYCALVAEGDFAAGVRLAVNHSGDSDSTGAIAGNLLGVMLGEEAIPAAWLRELELRDVIEQIADDLFRAAGGRDIDWQRYPGHCPRLSAQAGFAPPPSPDTTMNSDRTEIACVIARSGSMESIRKDAIG